MATPNIVPRADSEGGLGTASKYWASAYIDLIYVGAGKMGRDADNLLDFSTDNQIKIRVNGTNEIFMNNARFAPSTNDGYILGGASNQWSDLFLASGAVINFDNSNVTLTHSSNRLTLADSDELAFGTGNDLRISHNGTQGMIHNMTGDLFMINYQDDGDISFQSDDGSGGITAYITLDGSEGHTIANKEIQFVDNSVARFGTGNDMAIYHDGSNSFIQGAGTGDLYIVQSTDDKDIIFQSDDGSGGVTEYFRLAGNQTMTIASKAFNFTDNVKTLFGSSHDLEIYHDGTDSKIENSTGDLIIQNFTDDKDIIFKCDAGNNFTTEYFRLDGSSATHDGSATTALYTNWPDNSRISLGTSHDFQMYHTGTQTVISQQGTGNLVIQNTVNDADISFSSDDGSGGVAEYFRLDGGVAGTIFSRKLRLQDNVELQVGSSVDLKIYHDGSNSYIDNATGIFRITQSVVDGDLVLRADNGSGSPTPYLTLDGSETKTIFSKPIEVGVDNAGHDVVFYGDTSSRYLQWDQSADKLLFRDNVKGVFGNADDLQIYHDGTNSSIQNVTGNLTIRNDVDDADLEIACDNGSGGVTPYITLDGSEVKTIVSQTMEFQDNVKLAVGNSEDLVIDHNATNSRITNYTGNLDIINSSDDDDINFLCDDGSGGTTQYFRLDGGLSAPFTVFPDNSTTVFGNGFDLRLFHDSSHSYISQEGDGNLIIRNLRDDGAVKLQSDNGSGGAMDYVMLDGSDVSTAIKTIKVLMPNLPTSDPSVAGQLYIDASADRVLKVSAG